MAVGVTNCGSKRSFVRDLRVGCCARPMPRVSPSVDELFRQRGESCGGPYRTGRQLPSTHPLGRRHFPKPANARRGPPFDGNRPTQCLQQSPSNGCAFMSGWRRLFRDCGDYFPPITRFGKRLTLGDSAPPGAIGEVHRQTRSVRLGSTVLKDDRTEHVLAPPGLRNFDGWTEVFAPPISENRPRAGRHPSTARNPRAPARGWGHLNLRPGRERLIWCGCTGEELDDRWRVPRMFLHLQKGFFAWQAESLGHRRRT